MNNTERLAQRQLDAYNARDLESFVACFAPDIQLIRLQSGDTFCSGREQMREIYGPMFRDKTSLHCALTKRIVCGEIAIDEEHVSGMMDNAVLHAVAMYEVQNEIITRAWFAREQN